MIKLSRPRNYWYPIAQKMIKRYPVLDRDESKMAAVFKTAIENALDRTGKMENGRLRVEVIDLVYFKKTHTLCGAAMMVNVSTRTAQRWTTAFVNEVGRESGF